MLYADLTEQIISSFYKVYNALGYGFLEKVYENALAFELRKNGLNVHSQKGIKVFYEGEEVGDYFADMFVNELVIIELKAVESLRQEHHAQLINYCKATGTRIGLLLNFGKSPDVKRVAL